MKLLLNDELNTIKKQLAFFPNLLLSKTKKEPDKNIITTKKKGKRKSTKRV